MAGKTLFLQDDLLSGLILCRKIHGSYDRETERVFCNFLIQAAALVVQEGAADSEQATSRKRIARELFVQTAKGQVRKSSGDPGRELLNVLMRFLVQQSEGLRKGTEEPLGGYQWAFPQWDNSEEEDWQNNCAIDLGLTEQWRSEQENNAAELSFVESLTSVMLLRCSEVTQKTRQNCFDSVHLRIISESKEMLTNVDLSAWAKLGGRMLVPDSANTGALCLGLARNSSRKAVALDTNGPVLFLGEILPQMLFPTSLSEEESEAQAGSQQQPEWAILVSFRGVPGDLRDATVPGNDRVPDEVSMNVDLGRPGSLYILSGTELKLWRSLWQ